MLESSPKPKATAQQVMQRFGWKLASQHSMRTGEPLYRKCSATWRCPMPNNTYKQKTREGRRERQWEEGTNTMKAHVYRPIEDVR